VFLLLFHAMSLAPPELADMQREMIPTVRSQPGSFPKTCSVSTVSPTMKVRLYVLAIWRLVQRNLVLDNVLIMCSSSVVAKKSPGIARVRWRQADERRLVARTRER
jgi:hypothetical protein